MSVLSRSALESSPLADLHEIGSELGIDGFRRLRKADLIAAILERQGGDEGAGEAPEPDAEAPAPRRRRAAPRPRRTASTDDDTASDTDTDTDSAADSDADSANDDEDEAKPRRSRSRRGGRGRGTRDRDSDGDRDAEPASARGGGGGRRRRGGAEEGATGEDGGETTGAPASGTVDLLGNGSGFLRVSPPEPSDEDVYISAAQVRRCELVSGDTVEGPVRPPRRSERYPSLVRIDTINGRSADEVSQGTHFDDLPAAFPTERLTLGGDDPTLKAIEWLTPIGRGSRVTITGPARSGKTEALRRIAGALAGQEELELSVVLAGVRPEEVADWADREPVAALTLAASGDAQAQAVERAVDTAKRVAARGGHAVVLVDSLNALPDAAVRRTLAAARNIPDAGSLTILATVDAPAGGETTTIALDHALASTGRFPAVDLVGSGTLRPELLVGKAGADTIAQARAAAQG